MGLDLGKMHSLRDGIYDFLGDMASVDIDGKSKPIELDYEWDFTHDPIITPTIINEWWHLNQLLGENVLRKASKVLSIGGGGNSQTHLYLGNKTEEFYILNPSFWDLKYAKIPEATVDTTLVRAVAEALPFTSSCIDAIEIPSTIDHLVDPGRSLRECFRIMKEGGIIGITLGNSESWYRELVRFLRIRFEDNHVHHHNFHFSVSEIESLLALNGFVNIKTIGSAYLKMPRSLERKIRNRQVLKIHNFVSNVVLRRIFGNGRGGMFLTYGVKPQM